MTEIKIKSGQLSLHLYYSSDDAETHYVEDSKDKLYIKHRKNVPKKVLFFDTISETEMFIQKEIGKGIT